jgi:threonine/homoserine/homoserine lactone efflux protein
MTRVDVIRRILGGRPALSRVIARGSGAAMIVIGLLLLAEHLLA